MIEPVSYIGRLRQDLSEIERLMMEFLDSSSMQRAVKQENPFSSLTSNTPRLPEFIHEWTALTEPLAKLQKKLSRRCGDFSKNVDILFKDATSSKRKQIVQANTALQSWITYRRLRHMPNSREEAKAEFGETIRIFSNLLDELDTRPLADVVLMPDTNALVACSQLDKYRQLAGQPGFTVVIPSTVISELDRLKMLHANEEFRDKVGKIIRLLKGWRKQGNILEGVTIHKTITVRMLAKEPRFEDAPSWLDRTNNDDRIIATALEIQREYPSSKVILVTRDINHQNKAELARLPYKEPPAYS